ncbi:hypothetical protein [Streptomyces sp. NPDC058629]|uniref:hypothetical protein n=1 Tax=Streptomyces sp. NPDC058629 TaxID=3346565 RepID=UPI003648ECB9
MICVDCDRVILGPAVRAGVGESMSGARMDGYAHPPGSEECRPKVPHKRKLRAAMREQAAARR